MIDRLVKRKLKKLIPALPSSTTSDTPDEQLEKYRRDPTQLMRDAGFTPEPWQADLLNSESTMNLILCSRQVGKSTAVAMKALWTALTQDNKTVIIIAPIEPQANELLRKVHTAYNRIGRPVPALREAVTTLEFVNRSRVIALPGKERSVHSYTADLLIVDEAARVPDEVFNAATPQLSASKGSLIALSTAFSKSGWFYKEWNEGLEYKRWSITAKECSWHTEKFLDAERRRMGQLWYQMMYMNIFGDDIAAVFMLDDIRAMRDDSIQEMFAGQFDEDA
jgi:Terminase large subunit, T4likevirus-type, N-terminal